MASTTTPGATPDDDWSATRQVFARPELCALIVQHSDVVGAHRRKGVCRAMKEGAEEFLRALPGLVVCGGSKKARQGRSRTSGRSLTSEVFKLDLAKLQWERMPSPTRGRFMHASCVVRGRVVVLSGYVAGPA
jgi:hypothetical protein